MNIQIMRTSFGKLLFIAITLLTGCSTKENNPSYPIIHFGKTSESIRASQLIEINRIVPLETNDTCLIGHIDHADTYDGYIYLLDTWISKSLFVFDGEGRFITKRTAAAGGAGEFIVPYNFEIDRENKTLRINDVALNKILVYNLKSLAFIQSIDKPDSYNAIGKFPDKDLYVGYRPMIDIQEKHTTQIDILDTRLNRRKGFMPADPRTSILSGKPFNMYKYQNDIVVFPFFSNTLYTVTPDSVQTRYELRFGEYAFPPKELFQKLQYEPIPLFERLEKEAFIERMEPYETDEYLFVRYVAQTNDLIAIYHKENGERVNIPYKRIKNDLGINAFPIPLFIEGNLITGYIEPNAVDNPTGEHQEDNPILVTFNTIYAQRKAAPSHL